MLPVSGFETLMLLRGNYAQLYDNDHDSQVQYSNLMVLHNHPGGGPLLGQALTGGKGDNVSDEHG